MQYKKFIFGFDTRMNLIDDINRAPRAMELLEKVNKLGYVGTGRKYGVSDNAIRYWIKSYERDM